MTFGRVEDLNFEITQIITLVIYPVLLTMLIFQQNLQTTSLVYVAQTIRRDVVNLMNNI